MVMVVLQKDLVATYAGFMQFSHVLFQIEIATETLLADLAGIWFFIIMGMHVKG